MKDENWPTRAKCREDDPAKYDLDIVGKNLPPYRVKLYARAVCSGCPVAAQCAAAAIRNGDQGVIRGGAALSVSTSHKFIKARLAPALTTGIEPLSAIEELRLAGKEKPKDRNLERERHHGMLRKIERWKDRYCEECGIGIRPASIPEDRLPGRAEPYDVQWTRKLCAGCGDMYAYRIEQSAYLSSEDRDTVKAWEYRACGFCLALMKPPSLPADVWPDRATAHDTVSCTKCHEENTRIA